MIDKNAPGQRAPKESGGYRKITKSAAETTTSEHEEQEMREDVSGRYEKRLITSERRESKTSLVETFEPSGAEPALPPAWLASLPCKVRVRMIGVRPAGCADAEQFDGEYILDLLESRRDQCRWELTLPPRCHLYRICLVGVAAQGGEVSLRAFFEGSEHGPTWFGRANAERFGSAVLAFDTAAATNPCAGCQWPDNVMAEAIVADRAYISPEPTREELTMMADASSSGCASGGSKGYSILGPLNVPGLSKYTYQLQLPEGEEATNLAWAVNKGTATITGTSDDQCVVTFKNDEPSFVQLKATFKVNGTPKSTAICIAVVMVTVEEPAFATPGTPSSSVDLESIFLVNPPPPPQQPDWVLTHDPGSDCAAFRAYPRTLATFKVTIAN